ncbi:MAG: phage late control D family protein [Sphingomonadaceae bacterium]|nr:phage late control D family protein [Sphingomonadaceae bacterium]
MTANKAAIRLSLEDGTDLADKVNPRFLDLTLTEKRGQEADQLDITLHNHDGKLQAPQPGVYLSLALGWLQGDGVKVGLIDKGRFKVDEVSEEGPPDIITIRARSADLTGDARKRKARSWKDTTLGAILNQIASDNGWRAHIDGGLAGKAIRAIEQTQKSDVAFVRDLGQRYDAVATVKDKALIFMPIGAAVTPGGQPIPAVKLTKQDGWKWSHNYAQRGDHDGAEAQWHDQDGARRRTVKTGGEKRKRLKKVYGSEAEAKEAAEAEAKRTKRAPRTFSYDLAIADCSIVPNAKATLSGWSSTIDGATWLIEEVSTKMGSGGLTQSLKMESAG